MAPQTAKPSRSAPPLHPMPLVRVDVVLLSVAGGYLQVLLSLREEAPFKNHWGLPGGVLRIDLDPTLDAAAQRVATERIGRSLTNLSQVATVGGAHRDLRAPWAMSVVFRSVVPPDLETAPGKRVKALQWRPVSELNRADALAFDHAHLIHLAVEGLRQEIRDMHYPAGTLPDAFTLSELQAHSEAILGAQLDKVTFRRRLDAAGLVAAIPGAVRGGAHRPAQLYQFRAETRYVIS